MSKSSSGPQTSSTFMDTSRVEEFYVNIEDEIKESDELNESEYVNLETSKPTPITTSKEAEVENPFQHFKRPRRSKVWDDFLEPEMIKGKWKVRCKYCKSPLSLLATKSTTHLNRHLDTCSKKTLHLKQQQMINFLPSDSSIGTNQSGFVSSLHNGKFDMLKMREGIAHWLTMHEHPFTIVEEEGFNLMMKRGIPQWTSLSRHIIRTDSFKVYDFEKKKLKALLKMVDRISLTTDLWRSGPQRIEYMVLTAHFVDLDWKLQKRVLNFVHLPPPRKGANIANCILTCLREWEIENKVFTISVDNASANDSCIQILKDNFASNERLLCNGRLFHVRCCAHILNIMVQHGLEQVKSIIAKVHETVDFLNSSEARLKRFGELVSQYNVQERKLVLECKTRWNSTYDMLDCAIKFRKVFPRYALHDHNYGCCPTDDEWEKIEKLLQVLKVFKDTTNIISGSEYPTSNLFLSEVHRIKVLLDKKFESPDDFVRSMVQNMKQRFDKYWGECNMLMAIGAVLDPRLKMRALEITFPKMFSLHVARENISKVRDVMYQLYDEYVRMHFSSTVEESAECESVSNAHDGGSTSSSLLELLQVVRSGQEAEPMKSELDVYLDEGLFISQDYKFDALAWWKEKSMKFHSLSKLAANVLAVPITTVASEATFSAGGRVIDPYRSSLAPEIVQMLI